MKHNSEQHDWKKIEREDRAMFEEYNNWWREAFRELLGWSEQRISEWIDETSQLYCTLSGIGCALHELPANEILRELIPVPLWEKIQASDDISTALFGERLQNAIENDKNIDWYQETPHDWDGCRKRVEAVLAKYGYKLPREGDIVEDNNG